MSNKPNCFPPQGFSFDMSSSTDTTDRTTFKRNDSCSL